MRAVAQQAVDAAVQADGGGGRRWMAAGGGGGGRRMHRRVREMSGQTVAAALPERLNGQLVRHRFQLSLRPGRPQASLPGHLALITAITERRPAPAEAAARRHLGSVIAALLAQPEARTQEGIR